MFSVGIIGASGFTGAELLRLCAQHPQFNVVYATGDSQAGTLLKSLRQAGGNLLVDAVLFDIYRGKGVTDDARSLAFRFRFQAPDRTLGDTEIADSRARCIAAAQKLGAELR